jgi:sugar lactone lactonase YvrE
LGHIFVADTNFSRITATMEFARDGAVQSIPVVIGPTITNLPTGGAVGGSFMPAITAVGNGVTSVITNTPSVCTVGIDGTVSFIADGTCTLQPHVALDTTSLGTGFSSPISVATDSAGNLIVADSYGGRIVRMASDGSNPSSVGPGFTFPTAVALDSTGRIYVADFLASRVERMNGDGSNLTVIGTNFFAPCGVAVDADGTIYVADTGNNRVVKINADGSGQTAIGTGFSGPSSVTVDGAGHVFVADSYNSRIVRMNTDGSNEMSIGSGFSSPKSVVAGSSEKLFVADGSGTIFEMNSDGSIQTAVAAGFSAQFDGLSLDGLGNLLIADGGADSILRVNRFALDGTTQHITISGAIPAAPSDVIVQSVTDYDNSAGAFITWTNPSSNGDPAAHIKVQYSSNGTTWTTDTDSLPPTTTSRLVNGLQYGVSYSIRVIELDASGNESAPAETSASVTPVATIPRTPQDVQATPGNQAATGTWTNPTSNGDPTVALQVHYEVAYSGNWVTPSDATALDPTTTSYTVQSLVNGTAYLFEVRGVDAQGHYGGWRQVSAPVTPTVPVVLTKPGAPSQLKVKVQGTRIKISWKVPSNTGGTSILGYKVLVMPGRKACTTTTVLHCTISGLDPTKRYTIKVAARNSVGTGPGVIQRNVKG